MIDTRAPLLAACLLLLPLHLLGGTQAPAPPVERDILDVVFERSPGIARAGAGIQSGDPSFDAAVGALDDALPRPWTVAAMLALFESATAGYHEQVQRSRDAGINRMWDGADETGALVRHFSTLLAASRDPRAVLVLARQLEAPDPYLWNASIIGGLQRYLLPDPSYQRLPAPDGPIFSTNLLPLFEADVRRWWALNGVEVERRAAALPTPQSGTCAGCRPDAPGARATIAGLLELFRSRQPRLRLSFNGGATPRFVQLQAIIAARSGTVGASNSMQRHPAEASEIALRVPGLLIDQRGLSIRGLIMSPGYRTVALEVPDTSVEPIINVAFVALPTRIVRGTVSFAGDTIPRAFTLSVDVWIEGAQGSSGAFADVGTTLQGIAEAAVGADGAFTLILPDLTDDAMLNQPDLKLAFKFRPLDAPFVLSPSEVALGRIADGTLALAAAPRPSSTRGTEPAGR